MFKLVNKRLRNRKGFTLIELVVVVAILGILALIAIPRFAGVRGDAQDSAIESTAVSIINAAELYYISDDLTETQADGVDIADLITSEYLRGPSGNYSGFTLQHDGNGVFTVDYDGVYEGVAVTDYTFGE